MKKLLKSFALIACSALFASCMVMSKPVAATSNPVGSKCGVAKSSVILGIISPKGLENGIDKAAKSAGITKISHVDSYVATYFFGIYQEQITKVYGE